tara:strand:+ start:2789 stop:5032 length:2244 start_codon:yes stop_codon:yes gene_type:complete
MANIITVKFQPDGDKDLKRAINALATAQKKLSNSSEEVVTSNKKVRAESTKLNSTYVSLTSRVIAQGKSLKDLGLSNQVLSQAMRGNQVAVEKLKLAYNRLNTTTRVLGGSFAVIRSKLLLISFGTGLVTDSVLRLVNLYAEQELAEKRLTVSLGFRSEALIKQASALQAQTRFGDEAIIGAQAMLAAFIKDEEQLKKATDATLDLAAAKGMNLNSAADLVAKSIGSSTNSLTRYGIEAEGAAGSTERLDSIVNNIKDIFGGFAKGELDTTRGLLDATSNALGDAGEAFGKVLLPPVLVAARALKLVSESISSDRIKGYALAVGGLAIAYNRAAVATALFVTQINLSRAALIKSGYGIAVVALGELASRYLFASEATEESTKKIVENTEVLDDSEEQIQENIKSLRQRLNILRLNADEMSRTDQMLKFVMESTHELTSEEYELQASIVDLIISRKEEAAALKEIEKVQKRMEDFKRTETNLNAAIVSAQTRVNAENQKDAQIGQARLDTIQKLIPLHHAFAADLSDQEEMQRLVNEGLQGNLPIISNLNKQTQTQIDLLLKLLAIKEQDINSTDKQTRAQDALDQAIKQTALGYARSAGQYDSAGKAIMGSMTKELEFRIQLAVADAMVSVFKNVPYPMNFVLAAGAGAAAGSMLNAVMPKFEQGGMVGGNRHSQGGTIIEAERGEFVMSRDAVESIGVNNLEAMNAGGGGASVVINNPIISSEFVESELPELISEAVRKGVDFGMS